MKEHLDKILRANGARENSSELMVTMTQKAFENYKNEVRKETAKEIFTYFDNHSVATSLYPEMIKGVNATKFYKWLKEKYGVEVE